MQRSPPPGRGKRVPIHILSAIAFRSFRVLFHWITLLPQSLRLDETSRASSTQRLVPFPEDFLRSGNTWSTGRTVDVTGSVTCFLAYLRHTCCIYIIHTLYLSDIILNPTISDIILNPSDIILNPTITIFIVHVHFHSTHPWLSGILPVCMSPRSGRIVKKFNFWRFAQRRVGNVFLSGSRNDGSRYGVTSRRV